MKYESYDDLVKKYGYQQDNTQPDANRTGGSGQNHAAGGNGQMAPGSGGSPIIPPPHGLQQGSGGNAVLPPGGGNSVNGKIGGKQIPRPGSRIDVRNWPWVTIVLSLLSLLGAVQILLHFNEVIDTLFGIIYHIAAARMIILIIILIIVVLLIRSSRRRRGRRWF